MESDEYISSDSSISETSDESDAEIDEMVSEIAEQIISSKSLRLGKCNPEKSVNKMTQESDSNGVKSSSDSETSESGDQAIGFLSFNMEKEGQVVTEHRPSTGYGSSRSSGSKKAAVNTKRSKVQNRKW
jgi:hypothetical protein